MRWPFVVAIGWEQCGHSRMMAMSRVPRLRSNTPAIEHLLEHEVVRLADFAEGSRAVAPFGHLILRYCPADTHNLAHRIS